MKIDSLKFVVTFLALTLTALPQTNFAAEVPEAEAPSGLLGSWGGLKPKMNDFGLELDLSYLGEASKVLAGGISKDLALLGHLMIAANYDFEKKLHWSGWKINTSFLGDHGEDPSIYIGDALGTSNIEAPNTFKLYEAYLSKAFGESFNLELGMRDLNAEFYATASSGIFRHADFGIGASLSQTGENGPSIFPTAALAVISRFNTADHYFVQQGVFNAVAGDPKNPLGTHINTDFRDGYLLVWEAGFENSESKNLQKLSAGYWTYTKPVAAKIHAGAYLLVDGEIAESLNAFTRIGTNSTKADLEISATVDSGLVMTGTFQGRDADQAALGLVMSFLSDQGKKNGLLKNEWAVEALYSFEALQGLSIIPDLQLVLNPGFADKDPAFVGTLKVAVTL